MNMSAQSQNRGGAGGASARSLLVSSILLAAPLALSAQTATEAPPSATTTGQTDEVIVLSPFEVVGETRGYQATNTMSGTRFNTKLEDLASSITVMTKTQMSDFAMLDLNDVFLYVAGTEGSGTYTDVSLDRNGSISDNVQINPTQANRVRGLAPANIALGNIETMGRVPVDPITIDALEVSRGANANVFGLGNPSGTVNQVAASANPSSNRTATELRADSYGGWRTSLDVNQVLIKGKLAVRGSAVLQEDEFTRKPSGVTTERYNGMIKWQPYKYTTVSGSVFYYHAYGNRPNSLPPRDNISYWLNNPFANQMTWDPVTQTVHRADGTVYGTYTGTTYNGPDVLSAGFLGQDASQLFIDQAGLTYWSAPRGTTSTTVPNGSTGGAALQAGRFLQLTPGPGMTGTAGRPLNPLYSTTPSISDKSIYDWSELNLSSPNRFWDKTTTYNLAIDQIIIDNAKQTFAAQLAFMREDSERWTRNLVGIANDNGQSGQLTVDINERLLDGTPNPYFLRPYMSVDRPRIAYQPAVWDTARAQLAYRLDLTQEKNWLKWLGSHQVTAYGEYKHRVNRQYSYREGIVSNPAWLASTVYRGYQAAPSLTPALPTGGAITPAIPYSANRLAQNAYRFYVGDKITVDGLNVDYAPGDITYGTYDYVWGTVSATAPNMHTESLSIGQIAADKSGATFNTDTLLRTWGSVMQSHFLGDRLITTFGIREDNVRTKFGSLGVPWDATFTAPAARVGQAYAGILQGAFLNDDGMTFNTDLTDAWGSSYKTKGRTTNVQFMVRPFYKTEFANRLKEGTNPFGGFLGDALNGVSLFTNRSNSFLPISPSQDLYKNLLPNTTGRDKSWGVGLNLMDGKLYLRFTRFNNTQQNAQTTDLSTITGRVLRLDMMAPPTAGNPTPMINLHDTMAHAVQYVGANNLGSAYPAYVPQAGEDVDAVVARLTGLSGEDVDYLSLANPPIASTVDTRSIGSELEINYNPTKFWTVSASATDTKAINENVSPALTQWLEERIPIWTTLVDPSISTANATAEGNPNKLWWLHHYATNFARRNATDWLPTDNAPYRASDQTPQFNYQAFVATPFTLMRNLEGQSNPQVRRYALRFSTSYRLAGITDHKWLKNVSVGGAYRWEDKGAIGYYALSDTDLDINKPIYDKSHYYVDAFVSYKTMLWSDKISATFKINVKNIGQQGSLRPIGAFPNGQIHTYRIVDPQQFIFSATFEL